MRTWVYTALCIVLLACTSMAQQTKKTGVLDPADLKTVVPTNYFFDGLVATVQSRNSGAVRLESGKLIVAAFVDNSGYSSEVQAKYQGLLITEAKVSIGSSEITPGQYGFGFTKEGNFVVLDITANEILTTKYEQDDQLKRPVPLKIVADNDGYRLYAGKKYVLLKAK